MTASALPAAAFTSANPHALAAILQASETRRIIAATDIFDLAGTKLWARNQPVSAALQRKLLDRQLRQPLESCLVAEDGVINQTLVQAMQARVDAGGVLAPLLQPHGARLVREAAHLPLHPVACLLLTAAQAARPGAYEHALDAMALNGALMAGQGADSNDKPADKPAEVRLAMLCGLLHDIGEMYIAPLHGELEADRELDIDSYRQLVVHPHVGQLLLNQLTNYPRSVARALAEHHERLDGSGYPHALQGDALSAQGRLLAVTEAALGALRGPHRHLLRASVALRTVPGEFDLHWVGQVAQAAWALPPGTAVMEPGHIQARLVALGAVLSQAEDNVAHLSALGTLPGLNGPLRLAHYLLTRLRMGWNESGLWNPQALVGADAAEVEALEDEIYFRLRAVQRATLLLAGPLPEAQSVALNELCDSLAMG